MYSIVFSLINSHKKHISEYKKSVESWFTCNFREFLNYRKGVLLSRRLHIHSPETESTGIQIFFHYKEIWQRQATFFWYNDLNELLILLDCGLTDNGDFGIVEIESKINTKEWWTSYYLQKNKTELVLARHIRGQTWGQTCEAVAAGAINCNQALPFGPKTYCYWIC